MGDPLPLVGMERHWDVLGDTGVLTGSPAYVLHVEGGTGIYWEGLERPFICFLQLWGGTGIYWENLYLLPTVTGGNWDILGEELL